MKILIYKLLLFLFFCSLVIAYRLEHSYYFTVLKMKNYSYDYSLDRDFERQKIKFNYLLTEREYSTIPEYIKEFVRVKVDSLPFFIDTNFYLCLFSLITSFFTIFLYKPLLQSDKS
jgi:hypothetical protein